jgi:ribosomal protein S18 acetylase RimI-like enzyme
MPLEQAKKHQVNEICDLVNLAYRGEQGWTTEAQLVQGNRCMPNEVISYLSNPNTHLLVLIKDKQVQACICIEQKEDCAYIGFFAVHPNSQGQGVGKEVLLQAEQFALVHLNVTKAVMVVISQRIELIEYYESRGYCRVGKIQDYPVDLQVGVPFKAGMTIEYLEKCISPIE